MARPKIEPKKKTKARPVSFNDEEYGRYLLYSFKFGCKYSTMARLLFEKAISEVDIDENYSGFPEDEYAEFIEFCEKHDMNLIQMLRTLFYEAMIKEKKKAFKRANPETVLNEIPKQKGIYSFSVFEFSMFFAYCKFNRKSWVDMVRQLFKEAMNKNQ